MDIIEPRRPQTTRHLTLNAFLFSIACSGDVLEKVVVARVLKNEISDIVIILWPRLNPIVIPLAARSKVRLIELHLPCRATLRSPQQLSQLHTADGENKNSTTRSKRARKTMQNNM